MTTCLLPEALFNECRPEQHIMKLVAKRMNLLVILALKDGPDRTMHLADRLFCEPCQVIPALGCLVELGILSRTPLGLNARSGVVYELTDRGRKLSDALQPFFGWLEDNALAIEQGDPQ